MIYFAQLPTGAIKIGCSTNVRDRIRALERHYQCSVFLLHTMEGDRETEREIHERFAHLRFDSAGKGTKIEQFRPGADLMKFIGFPELASANPEAVEPVTMVSRELTAWPIDIRIEKLMSLKEAAKLFPGRDGQSIHYVTVDRYAKRGLKGVLLETVQAGHRRCTSIEAVQRFIEALTRRSNGGRLVRPVATRTARETAKAVLDACAQLEAAGC